MEADGQKLDDVEITEADMEDITGTGGVKGEEAPLDPTTDEATQDAAGDSLAPFIFSMS